MEDACLALLQRQRRRAPAAPAAQRAVART